MRMKHSLIIASFVAALLATPAYAQITPPPDIPPDITVPDLPPTEKPKDDPETETDDADDVITAEPKPDEPNYAQMSPQRERETRLVYLFARLEAADNADDANLIAEEIWAIWLDSGSASINLVLRRGSDAAKKGKPELARRLYDQVLTLQPDYAEGWARSARLALEERDFSRALTESGKALVIEQRHFYALWTMGNVFEQLGRQDEALEAYREAHKLYPELKAVKDRLEMLEGQLEGAVL